MPDAMDDDNTPADDVAAAHEALRISGPTAFVAVLVCEGKEYVFGVLMRTLLDQDYPAEKCHFHCIFDGPTRIAQLWWDRFTVEAEEKGAKVTSEMVELERHRVRWINVGNLREMARQRFMKTECSHLWWVECDCPPPTNALASLIEVNEPLVTGAVACRSNAMRLNHLVGQAQPGRPSDIDPPSLDTVLVSGLGCCLMERRALEQCAWDPAWHETEFIGGEDGYIQGRIKNALGCELLLDADVLVPHCDVAPRDPHGVICHIPVRRDGRACVERVDCDARETAGMWRPRQRPWTFVRPWRNKEPGELVPDEVRELLGKQYRWAYTHDGPELPVLDLAQHEVLLAGEAARIGGRYQPVAMDGSLIGEALSLERGAIAPGDDEKADDDKGGEPQVLAYSLVEIEVIEQCHTWA